MININARVMMKVGAAIVAFTIVALAGYPITGKTLRVMARRRIPVFGTDEQMFGEE